MAGFSVGGLMTGLDSNTLIKQLMQLERQPIVRIQKRISTLQTQRDAIRELRTQLQTLRSRAQDFRLDMVFDQFKANSTEESVVGAKVSGANPVAGAYEVSVIHLASATTGSSSSRLGANIDAGALLSASGIHTEVTAGTFTINGVAFTIDPAANSLNDVLGQINASAAGVTASYDFATDTVVVENAAAGDTSLINFGGTGDDSNFLTVIGLLNATQATGGTGSTTTSSTRNLGAINPGGTLNGVNFAGGAATSGTFYVNGVAISVDMTQDSVSDVLSRITNSDAQVTASYDSATDSVRLVSKTLGSRTMRLTSGTSNFLDVTHLTGASQTAGQDSQFTVNGGAVQTRNTNEVADAIGGVTLSFKSAGTSTVTAALDDDAIVEKIQEFITAFNESLTKIRSLTSATGALRSDGTLTSIEGFLRSTIFSQVTGLSGTYQSVLDIGLSTGDAFESTSAAQLTLDDEAFRTALRENRANVKGLFSNAAGTGVGDVLFQYLEEATKSAGFLNERSKANGTIDQQIRSNNDAIKRIEERLGVKERRLRQQFARLERISSQFQQQGGALNALSSRMRLY
jgi:flagellar hook-associated protein 2